MGRRNSSTIKDRLSSITELSSSSNPGITTLHPLLISRKGGTGVIGLSWLS